MSACHVVTGYTVSPGYCILLGILRAAHVLCPCVGWPRTPLDCGDPSVGAVWSPTCCSGLHAAMTCIFSIRFVTLGVSVVHALAFWGPKVLDRASPSLLCAAHNGHCLPSGRVNSLWLGRNKAWSQFLQTQNMPFYHLVTNWFVSSRK